MGDGGSQGGSAGRGRAPGSRYLCPVRPHSDSGPPARAYFARLDFPRAGEASSGLLFRDPLRVLVAHELHEVRPLLDAVERAAADGHHAVGFVGYDAAPAFDPALTVRGRSSLPLAWFGIFAAAERAPESIAPAEAASPDASVWTPSLDEPAHARAVEAIRDAIAAGDVYQVNFTIRLRALGGVDPLALYHRMRAAQPAGYGAYLDIGTHCIASASPELFFHRAGDAITTKPMKGTARRGRWLAEDDDAAARLAATEKERAENVMIVDLLRNDLGRIARPGTVRVGSLFAVERHPTVLQMTSTIDAHVETGVSLGDVFAALFPCGSVTGAPKVAAMRQIAALEDTPRGVYCGAIGHVAPSGEATFSVAIRTAWLDRESGVAEYGVGGAITWDSTPAGEHDELRAKAAVLTSPPAAPFELLETMRLTRDGYARRERHVARVLESARYFGFAVERVAVERALDAHAARATEHPRRVRMLVARDGAIRVEDRALAADEAGGAPRRVALATSPVSSADVFLFHKTTRRAVYDRHRAEHPDAFDVLLWNEAGELTEFAIGNVVLRLDGEDWTPPRECGLLAGCCRAELLERGEVRERVLTREDLERAEEVWLVNSVRGRVGVVLLEQEVPARLSTLQAKVSRRHGEH